MKTGALLLLCGAAALGNLSAASPVGLLPEEKQAVTVTDVERNPFGKPPGPKVAKAEDTESEEARIRSVFGGLAITGVGERDGEYSALLGSLFVKTGSELPPVVPGQKERLRVLNVQKDAVEIGFVEKDDTAETRKITLNVTMKPAVRYDLGVRSSKPEPAGKFGGVIKPDEPSPK